MQDRPIQYFPDTYSIKAVGAQADDFAEFVASLVRGVVGNQSPVEYRTRDSSKGGYLSVTLSFTAQSQSQLDEVFAVVSAQERVVWVL